MTLDRDSVERAIDGFDEPFLSAGYIWSDKPHRIGRALLYAVESLVADRDKLRAELTAAQELIRKCQAAGVLIEGEPGVETVTHATADTLKSWYACDEYMRRTSDEASTSCENAPLDLFRCDHQPCPREGLFCPIRKPTQQCPCGKGFRTIGHAFDCARKP
jgi:hypothetical protein